MIRNRALIALAFLLISAPPAYSEDAQTAPPISVPFIAEAGKVVRYRLERTDTTQATVDSAPGVALTLTAESTFKVLEALKEGYRVALTVDSANGSLPALKTAGVSDDAIARLSKLGEGSTVVYRADQAGNPLQIENLDEARGELSKTLKDIKGELANWTMPAEARDMVSRTVDGMLRLYAGLTPAQATQVLMASEIQLFTLGGIELPEGQEAEFEQDVPSPVGGPPIKMKNRIWISSVDDQRVIVELRSEVDPESAKASLQIVMDTLLKQHGGKIPEQARAAIENMKNFSIADSVTSTLRRSDGWPEKVASERKVTTGPSVKSQKRVFTRLD